LAWGANLGLGKMGGVSDIGYSALATISENVLRPETLKEANDRVSNAIADLPIFRKYDLGGLLHSSSDGQKFETRIPTINARHSPKYFGLHKGIVSYTLVANHIPVNATIIGATSTRATTCSISCSTTPPRSSRTCIPPIRMAPTR
jgi:TnpA family transposase